MADFTRQHQLSLSRDTTTVCLPHQENCARPTPPPPLVDLLDLNSLLGGEFLTNPAATAQ